MRFKGDLFNGWEEDGEPQKVLTDEQRAILKALADPVDNKKVLTDEQWKNQVEEIIVAIETVEGRINNINNK